MYGYAMTCLDRDRAYVCLGVAAEVDEMDD
jgi:hypothetical protein